jgi:plasmid stabilization system protein ParE
MESRVVFHRLVQRDMRGILNYYSEEAPALVADRFFSAFLEVVERALQNPKRYHPISPVLRRADIPGFPYHFLYRDTSHGIRILVLRHDRRHPSYGLSRR